MTPAKRPFAESLLALCLLATALPALAEKADRTQPVHIESDEVTLDDIKKLGIYRGKVLIQQGTLTLRADRVEVRQNATGLASITAFGTPVSFRQKRDGVNEYIDATAKRVEYDNIKGELRLLGDAVLQKGGDEIRGQLLTYQTATEFYRVVGDTSTTAPSGRVRMTIQPKSAAPATP
jgi:lipopolysaccharide export system protein LptA